jgi:hypothetical protein
VQLRGNARDWWGNAEGVYERGETPAEGAVLAFRGTQAMPYGHVAVVSKVLDARHVLLNHANWSRPGMIERGVLAVDVSPAGDWSSVRVWYGPSGSLGLRESPTFGFIYPAGVSAPASQPHPMDIRLASLGELRR